MTTDRRRLLLGIDSGQTVGKAALFTLDGTQVAVASAPTDVAHPRPRWAERDLNDVWQQVARAVREVVAQVEPDCTIIAVGGCGHNDGAYLVDDELAPVRPGILATDTRAYRYSEHTEAGETGRTALELTGQVPFPASPASLLAWLRDHEPDALTGARWAMFCKDWIRLRLTGEVATDPTEASASFLDVHDRTWSPQALDLYGLATYEKALPPVLASADIAGYVTAEAAVETGLAPGTPVVTGAHDVDAAALGIGAISAGSASVILGTFSINQVIADRPALDRRWQARAFIDAGRWLHMSTSPAGAANLDWVAQRVGPWTSDGVPDLAAAVERATTTPVQLDSPIFLPFLYGSPHAAALGASFAGLRGWHDNGDILRAVVEGVAFNHRTHMDALREQFDITRPVRVCGGGARSPEWTQLLSDVLGLPLEITDASEAGARGAALLAGIGVGVFTDLDHAAEVAVRVVRRHAPRAEAAALMTARYQRYLTVVRALSTGLPDADQLG